jgi:hypothetical protein
VIGAAPKGFHLPPDGVLDLLGADRLKFSRCTPFFPGDDGVRVVLDDTLPPDKAVLLGANGQRVEIDLGAGPAADLDPNRQPNPPAWEEAAPGSGWYRATGPTRIPVASFELKFDPPPARDRQLTRRVMDYLISGDAFKPPTFTATVCDGQGNPLCEPVPVQFGPVTCPDCGILLTHYPECRHFCNPKKGATLNKPEPSPLDLLRERRPELYELMETAARIQLAKASDYADTDSYRNLRDCEEMGIPAWKGVLVRLTDKFRRLKNFANKGSFAVSDESFVDTALDAVNYLLMCIVLFKQADAQKGL